MNINQEQTNGCDKTSRVYSNMFNMLQEVMEDDSKLKKLSPLDFSALGIYIGKFVEQEINSSVVQIMRAFCKIDMPKYYCRRNPSLDWDAAEVWTGRQTVRLNEQLLKWDRFSLKTIPAGDAYYALKALMSKDKKGFFCRYPWLNDRIFLEAWRNLFTIRNRMAHVGEIIDADTLKENYEHFLRFLRYMPDILKAKKELAPNEYIESLPKPQKEKKERSPYVITDNSYSDKSFAPEGVAQRYLELLKADVNDENWINEINDIIEKYNLDAIIFEEKNGKRGLKDCLGNILVPARYDGFGFIPKPFVVNRKSVNAIRDGKHVLVALDGSGKELTNEYDEIRLATYSHLGSPYVYRKNGMKAWGFMTTAGVEVCENIIDQYYWGQNSMWYDSGDRMGYWQFGVVFLPPIYDNIEMPGELEDPLLFTLNGIQGYVKFDRTFIPLSDYNNMDEIEQDEHRGYFVCEQYDID